MQLEEEIPDISPANRINPLLPQDRVNMILQYVQITVMGRMSLRVSRRFPTKIGILLEGGDLLFSLAKSRIPRSLSLDLLCYLMGRPSFPIFLPRFFCDRETQNLEPNGLSFTLTPIVFISFLLEWWKKSLRFFRPVSWPSGCRPGIFRRLLGGCWFHLLTLSEKDY
jgi:hypothetical protein